MEESPRYAWRFLVLGGVLLAVVLGAFGLHAFQQSEIVECRLQPSAGAQQVFYFPVSATDVGEGCRYALDAVRGTQAARWWWYLAGAVLAVCFALLPLAAVRRGPRKRYEEEVDGGW